MSLGVYTGEFPDGSMGTYRQEVLGQFLVDVMLC